MIIYYHHFVGYWDNLCSKHAPPTTDRHRIQLFIVLIQPTDQPIDTDEPTELHNTTLTSLHYHN